MFIFNEKYLSKKEGHYYSCPWIEHGLVFFKYQLSMCCHCGHTGGGKTLIRNNFIGQKIDWDRIFHIKNIFRNFHKKGKIHTSCINCPYLKEDKWDKDKYVNNLYISHWSQCNSKCIYCYQTQHEEDFKENKKYNIIPYIKEMQEKGILQNGGIISFGGGEPTLLDEFEELITYLIDNNYKGIRVHTSGLIYSKALARAINENKAYVVVSVDAGSKETYEKIKQIPAYEKVRDNINKYALKTTFLGRQLVSAKYIIIPNINDKIEEIEKWIMENYNAGLYTAVIDIEENWYLKNKDNIPKHIYKLVDYVKKRAKKLNMNFEMYERLENVMKDKKLFN